jgi:hypothetical protein
VVGGAPTLERVVVGSEDLPGYVEISEGARVVIRDSALFGTIFVSGGSTPTIESNEIAFVPWPGEPWPTDTIQVLGPGTAPMVLDNSITGGGISVGGGASGTIERNQIAGSQLGLFIEASLPSVTGNLVHDNGTGIEIAGAGPRVGGNTIHDNGTGISVALGGHPTIEDNVIEGNDVGVRVDSGSVVTSSGIVAVVLRGNTICGNGTNLVQTAGSPVTSDGGVCEDLPSPSHSLEPTAEAPVGTPGFETVEPRVERLTTDGAGHDFPADPSVWNIAFATDGTTWIVDDRRFFGFGDPREYGRPERPDSDYDLTPGPDGSLWALVGQRLAEGEADFLARFDGTTWHQAPPNPVPGAARALEVTPDGTVWAAWGWGDPSITVGRLRDGAWTTWQPVTGDEVAVTGLAAISHGHVWVAASDGTLSHFDGVSWESVPLPGDEPDAVPGPIAIGPDGTVWVYLGGEWGGPGDDVPPQLARLVGDDWTVYRERDGVPAGFRGQGLPARMAVGPDGRLWLAHAEVTVFDGTRWDSYLDNPSSEVSALSIAPDGSAWVGRSGDLYVIHP